MSNICDELKSTVVCRGTVLIFQFIPAFLDLHYSYLHNDLC